MKLSLDKTEKQFLLRKYMKSGNNFEEAKLKLNNLLIKQSNLVKQLRKKGKSNIEIENAFKEKFLNEIQSYY